MSPCPNRASRGTAEWVDIVAEAQPPRLPVLVIDDEPAIRRLVTLVLEEEGYAPVAAASAVEGLAVVAEHRPALVLLDLMMPELDGRETLRRIRALPGGDTIPVVIMSAALALAKTIDGVQGIIEKPFDLAALVLAVERTIGRNESEAAERTLMRGR